MIHDLVEGTVALGRGRRAAKANLFTAIPENMVPDGFQAILRDGERTGHDGITNAVTIVEQLGRQGIRSEEHTSELQSRPQLVCRLRLEKKNGMWDNTSMQKVASTMHCSTCLAIIRWLPGHS